MVEGCGGCAGRGGGVGGCELGEGKEEIEKEKKGDLHF